MEDKNHLRGFLIKNFIIILILVGFAERIVMEHTCDHIDSGGAFSAWFKKCLSGDCSFRNSIYNSGD